MSDYCRRCDGYSAEVGKPNDDGLCPPHAEIERLRAALDDIAYAGDLQDAQAKARSALAAGGPSAKRREQASR